MLRPPPMHPSPSDVQDFYFEMQKRSLIFVLAMINRKLLVMMAYLTRLKEIVVVKDQKAISAAYVLGKLPTISFRRK